jgi:hypothetical protein
MFNSCALGCSIPLELTSFILLLELKTATAPSTQDNKIKATEPTGNMGKVHRSYLVVGRRRLEMKPVLY